VFQIYRRQEETGQSKGRNRVAKMETKDGYREGTADGYELPPWDGKEPNYVAIFALTATSWAWVAVCGRLFARWKLWTLGADDWMVIPATVNNCSLLLPLF